MSSYFLEASTEIKIMISNYITQPSDLKALCLVSKEISAVAIPTLYYQVDLTPRELTQDQNRDDLNPIPSLQIGRLNSLLRNKKNLSLIRVLITSECDIVMTNMLDELLENLGENQLIQLYYGNQGLLASNQYQHRTENCFPTPEQMEFIWTHQQNLQTLHCTHLLTLFSTLESNEWEAHVILQPIRELILTEGTPGSPALDWIMWPIENVDTTALRKLTLVGWHLQPNIQRLNNLFASHAFANLSELYLKDIMFSTPFHLTNFLSLQSLTIVDCQIISGEGPAMLSIPHPLPITSLHYVGNYDPEQNKLLAPIITMIRGLRSLVLDITSPESEDEEITEEVIQEFRTDLAYALKAQQGTLTELVVREQQFCEASLVFGGEALFQVIQGCLELRRLALPLGLMDSVARCTQFMQDLPYLAHYWLMRWGVYPEEEDEEVVAQFMNAIPTETNLFFFAYEYSCYSREEGRTIEPTARSEPDANDAGESAFTRVNWKKANPLFYNRYPCLPVLPTDNEPLGPLPEDQQDQDSPGSMGDESSRASSSDFSIP